MMNTNNIVKKILGTTIKLDKISLNKKTTIPNKCFYCDKDLYYDKNNKNYIYSNAGEYVCKDCFFDSNIKKKSRHRTR